MQGAKILMAYFAFHNINQEEFTMNQFERLSPLLKSFLVNGPAGCACSVIHNGELKYQEYFGYSDLDTKTPITPDTIYRIFSMTKVITCTAALMLYERGLYLLNDPLGEYLPEFKSPDVYRYTANNSLYASPAAAPILVKDLFTMTSGLTYDDNDTETGRQVRNMIAELDRKEAAGQKYDIRDFSRALAGIPLSFDPGTHWRYSLGHDVLAAFVEAVSGKKFGQFLKDEIFEPLGMKNTFHRLPEEKKHLLCSYYDRSINGQLSKSTLLDTHIHPDSIFEGGGSGLLTTLGDYARFAQMLVQGGVLDGIRILGRKTVELMSANHLNNQQMADFNWSHLAGYGYGLGVRVLVNPPAGGYNGTVGEFGWAGMLGTWLLIDPKEQLSLVYMQQLIPNLEQFQAPRIHNVLYGSL